MMKIPISLFLLTRFKKPMISQSSFKPHLIYLVTICLLSARGGCCSRRFVLTNNNCGCGCTLDFQIRHLADWAAARKMGEEHPLRKGLASFAMNSAIVIFGGEFIYFYFAAFVA